MMKEINGVKLKKLDFELQKKGDLYSFEGPFLSHFRDERGIDYLMNWVDVNEVANRWILIKVTKEKLNNYFSRKLSLLQLIILSESGAVHFLDIDSNADYLNIWIVSITDIPEEYLPKEDSVFDANYANKYALQLAKENKELLSVDKKSSHRTIENLFLQQPNLIRVSSQKQIDPSDKIHVIISMHNLTPTLLRKAAAIKNDKQRWVFITWETRPFQMTSGFKKDLAIFMKKVEKSKDKRLRELSL
jgi:hypothetical protein